ncbi:MAG TPA: hypothetical protein VHK68_03695 [Gemmatimonadales bacterium]|nr:hypothetical protein [Gemmatimonadales bacterium]
MTRAFLWTEVTDMSSIVDSIASLAILRYENFWDPVHLIGGAISW